MPAHDLLRKYWGHEHFRPLQKEIIQSVLDGKDTLALLPTGGGKSICFQIPALAKEGICIVVSPLIALMKDQVETLNAKGITAVAVNSAMSKREVDITLSNCMHGRIKFLYVSPERIATEIFRVRVLRMNVNLIAVDEAHCISQWGYDFRPSYMQIAELRQLLPTVPVIALTATATAEVVKDIQQKLEFKKENLLQKSFERKNLAYVVNTVEDKLTKLLRICTNVKGTGIVYVRNRKKTQEISDWLNQNKITADYYHAGLTNEQRSQKQNNWLSNKTRVMVCTNAFGMGIDKPDVRFVVHIDLPDCIEAYFQEAGRAGRDEQTAYSVLLYNTADKIELEHTVAAAFPPIDEIKRIYQALANYFQIPIGAPPGVSFDFDINAFCKNYNLKSLTVFNCLKFLQRQGYVELSEALYQPSRLNFLVSREELYKFQVTNKSLDEFIKILLRMYSGLFDGFVKINEYDIARKTNLQKEKAIDYLLYLQSSKLISYLPQTEMPKLTYTTERIDAKDLHLSPENYSQLKERAFKRMEWVIHYAERKNLCRSRLLLSYFGENDADNCGQCDICLDEKKRELSYDEFEKIIEAIVNLLSVTPHTLNEVVNMIIEHREEKILKVIKWMMDNNELHYNNENKLELPEK
jgi:ATP-dependent DNA helicase RecQ